MHQIIMLFQMVTFITLVSLVYNDEVNAKVTLNSNFALLRQIKNKCDLTARPQCSSDCSSILVCLAGIPIPVTSINCHSDTPYCDKGICVKTPGSCSSITNESNFICTSSGVFPEPTDCTRYHLCSKSGSLSTEYACGIGSIYNSKSKLCQKCFQRFLFLFQKICEKISCDNVENDFVPFPTNPAYYAFCSVSDCGARQTFMYKCENEESHVFDKKTRSCIFNCKTSGYFADSSDCSVYYICNGRRTFTVRRVNCPPGFYFNGTACINSTKHCTSGSVIETTMRPSMESVSSTEKPTQVGSYEVTELSTEISSTQLYLPSIQSSTDATTTTQTAEITFATEPSYHFPYPSILFLPCPVWLQNEQICLGTGRHLNYGKRS